MTTEKAIITGSVQHYEMMYMATSKCGGQIIEMPNRPGIHCISEIGHAERVWILSSYKMISDWVWIILS